MAIWKDQGSVKPSPVPPPAEPPRREVELAAVDTTAARQAAPRSEARESVIASDITIEGKIEGTGHVRIAGRFNGDVNVQGDLSIEPGAKLTGGVRASKVTIAGELEGNIEAASHVELLATGVLLGDVKAGKLTVVAGSRMRGQAQFGWDEQPVRDTSVRDNAVRRNGNGNGNGEAIASREPGATA